MTKSAGMGVLVGVAVLGTGVDVGVLVGVAVLGMGVVVGVLVGVPGVLVGDGVKVGVVGNGVEVIVGVGAGGVVGSAAQRMAASNKIQPSLVRCTALLTPEKKPTRLAGAVRPTIADPAS